MFSHDVMAAIRAIVGLIQARFHQEWNTAAKRGDAESDRYAPKVGSVTGFEVDNSQNCIFAAGTGEGRGVIEIADAG